MARFLTAFLIAALLGGCVVVPAHHGYRDGPYYGHRHHYWGDHHYDGGGYWRYRRY